MSALIDGEQFSTVRPAEMPDDYSLIRRPGQPLPCAGADERAD